MTRDTIQRITAEWGDAVAAIQSSPGAPDYHDVGRAIAMGDLMVAALSRPAPPDDGAVMVRVDPVYVAQMRGEGLTGPFSRIALDERGCVPTLLLTTEPTPTPDTAEWWRAVAQELGVEIHKLKLAAQSVPGDLVRIAQPGHNAMRLAAPAPVAAPAGPPAGFECCDPRGGAEGCCKRYVQVAAPAPETVIHSNSRNASAVRSLDQVHGRSDVRPQDAEDDPPSPGSPRPPVSPAPAPETPPGYVVQRRFMAAFVPEGAESLRDAQPAPETPARACHGCGYSLVRCYDCKRGGAVACCPDCDHSERSTEPAPKTPALPDVIAPCPSCVSERGKPDPTCPTCHGSGRCPSGAPETPEKWHGCMAGDALTCARFKPTGVGCAEGECDLASGVWSPAPEMAVDESDVLLRRFMWVNHGCPMSSLYGDDGEMQCNAMMVHAPIDFKREPLPDLVRMVVACLRTPETPAPDAMPEIIKGDLVRIGLVIVWGERRWEVREVDGRTARVRHAGLPDDCGEWGEWISKYYVLDIERNGVVIWRRQEAQP